MSDLTNIEVALITVLGECIGKARALHMTDLAQRVALELNMDITPRQIRKCIELFRRDGHRICGHPQSGYWLANTQHDIHETCAFLYKRAMTSLVQVSAMQRRALPDLAGQLGIPPELL